MVLHLEFLESLELLGFLHCQRHTFRAGIRSYIRPEYSIAQFCAGKVTISRPKLTKNISRAGNHFIFRAAGNYNSWKLLSVSSS